MKTALVAMAFLIGLPSSAALAQGYPSQEGAQTQEQLDHLHDHLQHDREHQQIEDAHDREHASGFTSERQHQEYHQKLDAIHGQVHDDHPGTEHSHYDGGYGGGQRYGSDQGYRGSYGPPIERRTVVTRYVTRYVSRPVHHHIRHRRVATDYRSY